MKSARECKDRFEDMAAFVMGELEPIAARELQDHLAACKRCREICDSLMEEEKEIQSGFATLSHGLDVFEQPGIDKLHEQQRQAEICVDLSQKHFFERVKNMIIAHKRMSVATAVIATALAVVLILHIFMFSSSTVAYALDQTVQANNHITSYHAKLTPPVGMSEVWVQLNPDGTPLRARIDYPKTEDGDKVVVFSEGKSGVWFKDKKAYSISPEKDALKRVTEMQKLCDPRFAFEDLQARKEAGKVEITTKEPAKEGDFLTLTVTPKNASNLQEVYEVNPNTKLAERVTYYSRQGDRWEQVKVVEYLDYNKEIDPKIFNLDLPKDVMTVDQIKLKPGLVKGDLTDDQIAAKVAREFFEALIAKDYGKAGLMYGGIPAEKIKEVYGPIQFSRIVEIGKPTAGLHPDPTALAVSVKVECGPRKWVQEFSPQVRLTDRDTAAKVVREFFEAIIRQDDAAVRRMLDSGLVFEGFDTKNSDKMKEFFELYKLLRIVEIGKSAPYPGTDRLEVPVKVEIEMNSERIKEFRPYIRPVYNQPDRWEICGGI